MAQMLFLAHAWFSHFSIDCSFHPPQKKKLPMLDRKHGRLRPDTSNYARPEKHMITSSSKTLNPTSNSNSNSDSNSSSIIF